MVIDLKRSHCLGEFALILRAHCPVYSWISSHVLIPFACCKSLLRCWVRFRLGVLSLFHDYVSILSNGLELWIVEIANPRAYLLYLVNSSFLVLHFSKMQYHLLFHRVFILKHNFLFQISMIINRFWLCYCSEFRNSKCLSAIILNVKPLIKHTSFLCPILFRVWKFVFIGSL